MTNRDFLKGPQDHTTGRKTARISAGPLLIAFRRHQIPCSIDSLSANGWTARLGDPSKGPYSQQGYFRTLDAAAEWLLEEAERRGLVVVSGGGQAGALLRRTSRGPGPSVTSGRGWGTRQTA